MAVKVVVVRKKSMLLRKKQKLWAEEILILGKPHGETML